MTESELINFIVDNEYIESHARTIIGYYTLYSLIANDSSVLEYLNAVCSEIVIYAGIDDHLIIVRIGA